MSLYKLFCTCTQIPAQMCAHHEFGLFSVVSHILGLEDLAKAQNTFSMQTQKLKHTHKITACAPYWKPKTVCFVLFKGRVCTCLFGFDEKNHCCLGVVIWCTIWHNSSLTSLVPLYVSISQTHLWPLWVGRFHGFCMLIHIIPHIHKSLIYCLKVPRASSEITCLTCLLLAKCILFIVSGKH